MPDDVVSEYTAPVRDPVAALADEVVVAAADAQQVVEDVLQRAQARVEPALHTKVLLFGGTLFGIWLIVEGLLDELHKKKERT